MLANPEFTTIPLDDRHSILLGNLPDQLMANEENFETLWNLHPNKFPVIKIHGKSVPIPRWQHAYGIDYRFSGATSSSLPVPVCLHPFLNWAQIKIDPALNGLLLNWYDGSKGHYIGKHRDSRIGLIEEKPIVTISLGEERPFRFQRWRSSERVDIAAHNGSVIVFTDEVNCAWTHAVPKTKKAVGRRISITIRAFGREGDGK